MQESNGTMSYRPKALEVKRGEQIKFVITNAGMLAHEFILAWRSVTLDVLSMGPGATYDSPSW